VASWLETTVAAVVASPLAVFALRRGLLVYAALLPRRPFPSTGGTPRVALVVAARNESVALPGLLDALDSLDYPADRLHTIVVDDASTDATPRLLASWSDGRPETTLVRLSEPVGKAAALNAGIAAAGDCDAIAICDADHRPRPDCLRMLTAPLADEHVGAVSGFKRPANAYATPVSRYAALEAWMTQLVTSAGKDRLGLDPPTLGFCAYRRSAYDEIEGFRADAVEDLVAAVSLAGRGWRLRFVPEAIVDDRVVEHVDEYWRQHSRWARNTFDAGRFARSRPSSAAGWIETWLMSAGYADRVALLASAVLGAVGWLPVWVPLAYVGLRGVEVVVALVKGGVRRQVPVFFAWALVFFVVDVVASVVATLQYPLRRRPGGEWRSPARRSG
jgi:cellulose synthase/poly-beta-1,6-N-acetylglucosamine synthase-like glycosyltransferase